MALPGYDWPLLKAANQLAFDSDAARKAVLAMMEIDEDPVGARRAGYTALFGQVGPGGRPLLWTYEAGALSGRLFSEETLDVEQWYRLAGLDVEGMELPDHVSLELEFLSVLAGAEQLDFSRIELGFIQRHAGRWMPQLGRALQASGDPVYAPIGQLLADWIEEVIHPHPPRSVSAQKKQGHLRLPILPAERLEECTLCGFCVQRCPIKALKMFEDAQTTNLLLSARQCVGCAKCVRVCDPGVLKMAEVGQGLEVPAGWSTLRQSPRVTCQACGAPMVSQAEFDYVAARLGNPRWLKLCQNCRSGL